MCRKAESISDVPAGSGPVGCRDVAAEAALLMAVALLPCAAPSIRSKATKWPPSSTTATLTFNPMDWAESRAAASRTRAPASVSLIWSRTTSASSRPRRGCCCFHRARPGARRWGLKPRQRRFDRRHAALEAVVKLSLPEPPTKPSWIAFRRGGVRTPAYCRETPISMCFSFLVIKTKMPTVPPSFGRPAIDLLFLPAAEATPPSRSTSRPSFCFRSAATLCADVTASAPKSLAVSRTSETRSFLSEEAASGFTSCPDACLPAQHRVRRSMCYAVLASMTQGGVLSNRRSSS